MYIPELWYPGVWLEGLAPEESHQVQILLFLLESAVADAALSLTMFEAEAARPRPSGKDQSEADRAREAAVHAAYEQRLPTGLSEIAKWQALDPLREQIRVEAKRLKWASGEMPDAYRGRLQFVHAKSFVYALDTLERVINNLADVKGAPSKIAEHREEMITAVPGLRQVRNSAHHVEDRARGKHRVRGREEDIVLRPVSNRLIHAPGGGALVIDALNGNRYGCTTADGEYGEVEVSAATLAVAHQTAQAVINAFQWKGPERHTPI